jgi:hypothetical protein
MAFREKMLWVSASATLLLWGWYFARFVTQLRAGSFDQGAAVGNFIMTIVLLIAVQGIAGIALAIMSGREAGAPADDREKAFSLGGYRVAYFVLAALVVTLMLAGPVLLRIANEWTPAPPPGLAPVLLGNALLLALVAAELAHSGYQLFRYRRGG